MMSKSRRAKSSDKLTTEDKRRLAGRKILESMAAEIDRIKADRERKIWELRSLIRKLEEVDDVDLE